MKIAFGCYLLVFLGLGILGLVYLFRSEFLPYHAEAVAREWEDVEQPFQVLILALMRVVGGAWVATALAAVVLLFVPFRQGARWARWAIPAVGLVALVPALYATLYVGQQTPASPPWILTLIGIVLLVVGFSLSGGRTADDSVDRTASSNRV